MIDFQDIVAIRNPDTGEIVAVPIIASTAPANGSTMRELEGVAAGVIVAFAIFAVIWSHAGR